MEYEVSFLASAWEDLDSIVEYLSQFYPNTPERFLDALEKGKRNLQFMPSMYPVYEKNPIYRKMIVSNYLVFYAVDNEEFTVKIHRIIPGSWDIGRHIE